MPNTSAVAPPELEELEDDELEELELDELLELSPPHSLQDQTDHCDEFVRGSAPLVHHFASHKRFGEPNEMACSPCR